MVMQLLGVFQQCLVQKLCGHSEHQQCMKQLKRLICIKENKVNGRLGETNLLKSFPQLNAMFTSSLSSVVTYQSRNTTVYSFKYHPNRLMAKLHNQKQKKDFYTQDFLRVMNTGAGKIRLCLSEDCFFNSIHCM